MSTSTLPDKATRDENLKKVRDFHAPNITRFGLPDLKVIPKLFFTPKDHGDKTEKFMSFFHSEVSEGKDLYVENCESDNSPIDPERRLYKWRYNPYFDDKSEGYKQSDKRDKNGKPYYQIPVDELELVLSYPDGKATPAIKNVKPGTQTQMFVPEGLNVSLAQVTLLDLAALILKKPISEKPELNKLIKETK